MSPPSLGVERALEESADVAATIVGCCERTGRCADVAASCCRVLTGADVAASVSCCCCKTTAAGRFISVTFVRGIAFCCNAAMRISPDRMSRVQSPRYRRRRFVADSRPLHHLDRVLFASGRQPRPSRCVGRHQSFCGFFTLSKPAQPPRVEELPRYCSSSRNRSWFRRRDRVARSSVGSSLALSNFRATPKDTTLASTPVIG